MSDPVFVPATAERWADLETVMASCANGRKCWCAYWIASNKDFQAGWGEGNRLALKTLTEAGTVMGLIAYVDGVPAAWVGVAPRSAHDRLRRSKNFAARDALPVWSITCFIVRSGYRKQGMMSALIQAAVDYAFAQGAPAVEAYPMEPGPKTRPADLYLGTPKAFLAAGFAEVARPLPRRPFMRLMRPEAG